MGATPAETAAMRRALRIAANPGVPLGPNPRVGCVLLADDGTEVAEGFHRGAGTPHAEVDALAEAYPGFSDAVVRVVVDRDELTLHVRPDKTAEVLQALRDDDPAEHTTQALAALSLAWSANDDLQFDIFGAAGLNHDTPDARLYAGISRRF